MSKSNRPARPRKSALPSGYAAVLVEVTRMIGDARRRALASVNRELVRLYWEIGRVIVAQQEKAAWGEAVVERLSADLRAEFPDMKGLSLPNMWKMRQVFLAYRRLDGWLVRGKLSTVSRELSSPELSKSILGLSWSHHTLICSASDLPDQQYFYLQMAVRERWSVRELERQIESDLFTRYVSVKRDPEKCLPAEPEQGDLLPFKDRYLLDFLGLEESHTERQLRQAMLANLRDLFLELGRDFTLVGEEYPVVAGDDTFGVDLLFFHRRLQCLVATELKTGKFKPEYVGKCQFYLAALDEQVRLPHEKPSVGLILCKSANGVQMRLALTAAARKIGVATYQTALPEERLILQRLERLPALREPQP
jgi:predicted nuclease of restriction endonuclease-like (RecB) superfamily